jgi:hypothetical protein
VVKAKFPQSGPVIALSSTDVWATTGVGVLHWDGTQWAFADLPKLDSEVMESFAAASPDSIWAVGGTTGAGGYVVPLILHWDGTRWSRSDVPPHVGGPLYAVAVAGNDVDLASVTAIPGGTAWAVGYSGVPEPGEEAVIFHWSGTGWTVAWQLAEPAGYLNGIGVVSASDAWSVAYVCTAIDNDNGCAKTRFLALHWDGRTWNESWLPANFQPSRSTRSAASWAGYWK